MRGQSVLSYVNKIRCYRKVCITLFLLFLVLFSLVLLHPSENVKTKGMNMSWFQHNQNISHFLKIDHKTCIVCRDFSSSKQHQAEVIIYVTSAPSHAHQRLILRETWGKAVHPPPLFITGISEDKAVMKNLLYEANLCKDIIIENFIDTYLNLTLKTGFILKHYTQSDIKTNYVMKTDDDVLINPKVLLNVIKNISIKTQPQDLPIIGFEIEKAKPIREPNYKWYISDSMYKNPTYPLYTSGLGYIIPANKIQKILKGSFQVKLFPFEDVFFTGIVRERENIAIVQGDGMKYNKPYFNYHCFYRQSSVVHHLSTDELELIWEGINSNSDNFCRNWLIKFLIKYIF